VRSKSRTVFSDTRVRVSFEAMMPVRISVPCAVLALGRGLATGSSHIQGGLPTVYTSRNRN
jgi:hypothetical protein